MEYSNVIELPVSTAASSQGLFRPEAARVDVVRNYDGLPSAANNAQAGVNNNRYGQCYLYGCALITAWVLGSLSFVADDDDSNDQDGLIYAGLLGMAGVALCCTAYCLNKNEDHERVALLP